MTYWREKAVSQNILVGHSPMKDEEISKVNKRTLNYYFKKIFFKFQKPEFQNKEI